MDMRRYVCCAILLFDLLKSLNHATFQTFDKETRKALTVAKQRSSIPIILRDMAPPEGSIFDREKKGEEEKERRRLAVSDGEKAAVAAEKKKASGAKKETKKTAADAIKANNAADKLKKEHERDLQKLSNLKTLRALQDTTCETTAGKIHRMIKMMHLAVCDLRQGAVNASEAEVLDILWALEAVSYTHLRAHETVLDLVCRLLLEKKT